MRHVLVHDYANVVSKTLYDTAVNDIPVLKKQVEHYLAETNWDEWQSAPDDFEDTSDDVRRANIETARKMIAKGFATADMPRLQG